MQSSDTSAPHRVSATHVRLMAAGLLLLQLVWVFAVPPFRGADEFDHAYRAASAARGELRPEATDATRGTGAFVVVPDDIVAAAEPECSRLPYTTASDCVGTATDGGTTVSTGAGRYHPAFYAVIGAVALPFDGADALYAMRLANVLLCFIAFAAALASLRTWATSAWPFAAFALVCSPMVVFNTSVAAPNGLEMAASLALWTSLLGLAKDPTRRGHGLVGIAVASAVTVVTLRSLGPLWVVLVVLSVAAAAQLSWRGLRQLLARRDVRVGAAIVAVATAASLWWIVSASSLVIGTLKVPDYVSDAGPVVMYSKNMTLWVLQSIGAFPYRDQAAPAVLYAAYLVPVTWLLGSAARRGSVPQRITLCSLVVLSLAIPVGITAATIDRHGLSWNGGYTIPFSMGMFIVAGAVLDDRPRSLSRTAAGALGIAYVAAHVIGPVVVFRKEVIDSPSLSNGSWMTAPSPVLAVLALVGAGLLWTNVGLLARHSRSSAHDPPEAGVASTVAVSGQERPGGGRTERAETAP